MDQKGKLKNKQIEKKENQFEEKGRFFVVVRIDLFGALHFYAK